MTEDLLSSLVMLLALLGPVAYVIARVRAESTQPSSEHVSWYVPTMATHQELSTIAPAPTKRIPLEIQQEIDQAPEWWDREFHRLLGSVDEPIVHEVSYVEERSFTGKLSTIETIRKQEFAGCPCAQCLQVRREYS